MVLNNDADLAAMDAALKAAGFVPVVWTNAETGKTVWDNRQFIEGAGFRVLGHGEDQTVTAQAMLDRFALPTERTP